MIVDTSALLAYFDSAEPRHDDVARVLDAADTPLVISPYVLAELDYLVLSWHGVDAELLVLDELASGAWTLETVTPALLEQCTRLIARFRDQRVGVADASNIVLADTLALRTIVTLDRRHFDVLRFADGSAPRILP